MDNRDALQRLEQYFVNKGVLPTAAYNYVHNRVIPALMRGKGRIKLMHYAGGKVISVFVDMRAGKLIVPKRIQELRVE